MAIAATAADPQIINNNDNSAINFSQHCFVFIDFKVTVTTNYKQNGDCI